MNLDIVLVWLWECLEDRYGRFEMIEVVLKNKFLVFLRFSIKDNKWLYDFVDIVLEIEVVKEILYFFLFFVYFDLLSGVNFIVLKFFY